MLGKGFIVNYDEIVNHGTYGGGGGGHAQANGKVMGGSISSKVAVMTSLLIVKYRFHLYALIKKGLSEKIGSPG